MQSNPDILRYNTIESQLIAYLEQLDCLAEQCSNRLAEAPSGHILVSKARSSRPEYYVRSQTTPRKAHYIPKSNFSLAKALLQKRLDGRLLKYARREASGIRLFLEKYCPLTIPAEALSFSVSSDDWELRYPFEPDALFLKKWETAEYPRKPFRDDQPEFFTDKGERVRSKSEVLIANMLRKNNISYRYECPLQLKYGGLIHPDFTLLDIRTRKIYYLEHLGMMDDRGYVRDAIERIQNYQRSGFLLGRDLIVTFETSQSPINIREIERELRQRLSLPS